MAMVPWVDIQVWIRDNESMIDNLFLEMDSSSSGLQKMLIWSLLPSKAREEFTFFFGCGHHVSILFVLPSPKCNFPFMCVLYLGKKKKNEKEN